MARSVTNIYNDMVAAYVAAAASAGITITPTAWSAYNYQRLLIYASAFCLGVSEQLWDSFKTSLEALISAASPQTGKWFQSQMLKFQYDATNPQIVEIDSTTFAPTYPVVDTNLQIIKYCSVVAGAFGTTTIKVAKQTSSLPDALSSPEKDAAQGYVNEICVPGITANVVSSVSDKVYIAATIYYNGLYAGVIKDNIITAIKAYLQIKSSSNPNGIPFDGYFTLSDLEIAIKGVAGVTDLVFTNVRVRTNGVAYPGGTVLVSGVDGTSPIGTVYTRRCSLGAGYCQTETTSTHEITDSLTLIAV